MLTDIICSFIPVNKAEIVWSLDFINGYPVTKKVNNCTRPIDMLVIAVQETCKDMCTNK